MTEKELAENKRKLAEACRILYMEGLADYNLGHASFRVPGKEMIYVKPRGLGLEEVTPEDLIVIDFAGRKISGEHPPHGENPIHTGIYKARGDVGSVVHAHPVLTTAFSSSRAPLRPMNQEGAIFPRGIPVYESPELVKNDEQARDLARTLGDGNAAILRNHGAVTVGPRIEEACLNALFLEGALRIQRNAALFGEITSISEETALRMNAGCRDPKRYDMIWSYLVRKLKRAGLALPDHSGTIL